MCTNEITIITIYKFGRSPKFETLNERIPGKLLIWQVNDAFLMVKSATIEGRHNSIHSIFKELRFTIKKWTKWKTLMLSFFDTGITRESLGIKWQHLLAIKYVCKETFQIFYSQRCFREPFVQLKHITHARSWGNSYY